MTTYREAEVRVGLQRQRRWSILLIAVLLIVLRLLIPVQLAPRNEQFVFEPSWGDRVVLTLGVWRDLRGWDLTAPPDWRVTWLHVALIALAGGVWIWRARAPSGLPGAPTAVLERKILTWMVVAVAAGLAVVGTSPLWRYEYHELGIGGGSERLVRVDRLTGQTCWLWGAGDKKWVCMSSK